MSNYTEDGRYEVQHASAASAPATTASEAHEISAGPDKGFCFVPAGPVVDNALLRSMAARFERCLETARRKNRDYAGTDYSGDGDPFENFRRAELVGVSVERGILVRLTDKLARLSNLLDRPAAVEDERLTDTIDDAINYLAILGAWLELGESDFDCS